MGKNEEWVWFVFVLHSRICGLCCFLAAFGVPQSILYLLPTEGALGSSPVNIFPSLSRGAFEGNLQQVIQVKSSSATVQNLTYLLLARLQSKPPMSHTKRFIIDLVPGCPCTSSTLQFNQTSAGAGTTRGYYEVVPVKGLGTYRHF